MIKLDNNNKLKIARVITGLMFLAMSFLIFAQVYIPVYFSDWSFHLEFVLNSETSSTYSLFHFILYIAYVIFKSSDIMAAVAVILGVLLNAFSYILIRNYLSKKIKREKYFIELISLSLFVVSMIIPFSLLNTRCYGVGTPNPWHNPTYIFARPFAICSFILIAKVHELLESGKKYVKPLVLFSISMLISVLMKPSFYFAFLPALFLYYLYILVKSKFTKLVDCFFLGLSVVPAGLILIYQNTVLFGGENSIRITLGGELWREYAPAGLVSLAILLGLAFPIFVTVSNIRRLSYEHIIGLLTCLFGMTEAYFFVEDGPRYYDGNFFWSYYFGMFFAFVVSVITFINNKDKTRSNKIIGYTLFLLHLISGIVYFIEMLLGKSYI